MFTLRDVYAAGELTSKHIRRTPLIYSRKISKAFGFDVYLKLENLQITRSFKVRGGVYYVQKVKSKIFVTASMGNHAQSIAYASSLIDAKAVVVMPKTVPRIKIEAVEELGGEVVLYGNVFEEAAEYSMKLAKDLKATYVHPANDEKLYPGVATMHLENLEDLPDVDVVINPIGGGSGASGAIIVYKSVDQRIKVIGVQAEGASSFYESWKQGKLFSTGKARTIAEGLAVSRAYELPFSILKDRIDNIILVSDEEIKMAIKTLLIAEGQVAEGAGAAALAAAYKLRKELEGKKVIVMVTGGNAGEELLLDAMNGKSFLEL